MKQNVTIDRLRGFSVLAVFYLHYAVYFPNILTFLGSSVGNGYYGVTAFFCTSGFLITAHLLNRYDQVAKTDLYAFYVRRFGRIAPPLTLLLLVLSLLSVSDIKQFNFPAPLSLRDSLLYAITFRYNVYFKFCGAVMPMWGVLWSLSIEEVFYLVYPLTAKVTRNTFWLAIVLVALIVYAPLYRLRGFVSAYEYLGCFDAIAIGALTALAAKRFSRNIIKPASWAVMILGIGILAYSYAGTTLLVQYITTLTLVAFGAGLILFASQCAPFASTRAWSFDPLVYLGRLSYEIYLFHVTVFVLLRNVITPRFFLYPIPIFIVVLFCVVVVSDVVGRFYAEPLNKWLRTRLLSARKPRAAEEASPPQPSVLSGSPGLKFARLFFVLLLGAQLAYTVHKLPAFFPAQTASAAEVPPHPHVANGLPEITIHNPQGTDGAGDFVWYWLGPDATVELTDYSPPGKPARRFSLVFNAGAGPSNGALARSLILRDSQGHEQTFSFFNTAMGHFKVSVLPGKNVYTLKVAYPTETNVVIPSDPRKLMVRVEHFMLTDVPPAAGLPMPSLAAPKAPQ